MFASDAVFLRFRREAKIGRKITPRCDTLNCTITDFIIQLRWN